MGKFHHYTQRVADEVCKRLAEGHSLRSICRDERMPSAPSVLRWAKELPEFSEQYTKARAIGYELLADELLEISDDSQGDVVVSEEGIESTNHERIARSRLRVDTRKWMLSKMLPKVFGDKLETTHKGDASAPIALVLNGSDVHG